MVEVIAMGEGLAMIRGDDDDVVGAKLGEERGEGGVRVYDLGVVERDRMFELPSRRCSEAVSPPSEAGLRSVNRSKIAWVETSWLRGRVW